jgi:hypothetical protein
MTTSDFIRIKKTIRPFKLMDAIDNKKSNNTSFLMDFCTLAHPNTAKSAQGHECQVFTGNKHYIYNIYEGIITRCEAGGINKVTFKL